MTDSSHNGKSSTTENGRSRPAIQWNQPADSSALNEPPLRDRVAIFIDGANLFHAALHLGIEIDYTKLLDRLTAGRKLLRAYFYTGVDRSNDRQQRFLMWMRRHGYRVVEKDLTTMPDGHHHVNVDVEIAVDMLLLASYCDTVVLLSGDGDLTYAVTAVADQGANIEIVSLSSMTSEHLINAADLFIDLASLRADIQRHTE